MALKFKNVLSCKRVGSWEEQGDSLIKGKTGAIPEGTIMSMARC